jgi:outer membrane lipoprotein SlyB
MSKFRHLKKTSYRTLIYAATGCYAASCWVARNVVSGLLRNYVSCCQGSAKTLRRIGSLGNTAAGLCAALQRRTMDSGLLHRTMDCGIAACQAAAAGCDAGELTKSHGMECRVTKSHGMECRVTKSHGMECRVTKSHGMECRVTKSHGMECRVTKSHGMECRITKSHGMECRVTKSHGMECRVTKSAAAAWNAVLRSPMEALLPSFVPQCRTSSAARNNVPQTR